MNLKLYILSITVWISMVFSLSASTGESIYNESGSNLFVFEYSAAYSGKRTINNFFIKEIAKYNLSNLGNTQFTLHYSIDKKITRVSPYTYNVSLVIETEKCTGNINYKDFDISDILMPELADIKVIVDDNGNYIEIKDFDEIKKQEGGVFSLEFNFDAPEEDKKLVLKTSDISFYSEQSDKQHFYDRITFIDNYYASIAAMDKSLERIEKINFSPAMITKSFFQLHEYNRIFNQINNSDFITELQLDEANHSEFFLSRNKFERKLDEYSNLYKDRLFTLDFLYLYEDLSGLAEEFVNEVNYFCLLSENTTHVYQSYFYNLGMVDYSDKDIVEVKEGFMDLLSRTKYKKDSKAILNKFFNEVLKVYIRQSTELIKNDDYRLARGMLLNAKQFAKAFIESDPPRELGQQLSKASYGIYNSYLHLIDRAIEIGNYELADNYISKAKIFQEENSSSIISNQSVRDVSGDLVKLYINKGYSLIKEEDFFEAGYCFGKAHEKCQEIKIFNYDYVIKHGLIESRNGLYNQYVQEAGHALENGDFDLAKRNIDNARSLMKSYPSQINDVEEYYKIKNELLQQVYNYQIIKGRVYWKSGNYSLSYTELLAAVELEEHEPIIIDSTLGPLFKEAAIDYLSYQCMLGGIKVKKQELDNARKIYGECLELQDSYGFYNETRVKNTLASLNRDILLEQCNIVVNEIDKQLFDIDNYVKAGEFIFADELLSKANLLAQSNQYCGINQNHIQLLNQSVPYAAEYQKLAIEAQSSLENNKPDFLLEIFEKMEELSDKHEIIRRNIEPRPLFYLFAVKKNLAFLESSIKSYTNDEEVLIAMRMMNVLQSGAATGKASKPIQVSLAQKMAANDRQNASIADPIEKAKEYTGGSSYFKYFKKAYVQSWNDKN